MGIDARRLFYEQLQKFQRRLTDRSLEDILEEYGEEFRDLVSFAELLLEHEIDVRSMKYEDVGGDFVNLLFMTFRMFTSKSGELDKYLNRLKNEYNSLYKKIYKISVEEKDLYRLLTSELGHLKQRIEHILDERLHLTKLEKFVYKILTAKPQGTELLIANIILKAYSTTDVFKKIFLLKSAIDLIPEKQLVFTQEELEKMRAIYSFALAVKRAIKINDGYNIRVSMQFPFSENLIAKYLKDIAGIDNIERIIRIAPLNVYHEKRLREQLKSRDPEKMQKILSEIFYIGIPLRVYNKIALSFVVNADRIVNEIIQVIMSNMRMVRYFVEKNLEKMFS